MSPRLEDFQNGVPLNEELRRIKAGVMDEPEPPLLTVTNWDTDNVDRPLTDAEREDLARLTMEPGWRVLERKTDERELEQGVPGMNG